MPVTFGETWRAVRLQVPAAPALLCQRWVQDTYNTLCDRRGWAWLRKETTLTAIAGDTHLVVPADFGRFLVIADEDARRQLPWWVSEEEIRRTDPDLSVTGPPRLLASASPSTTAGPTLGRLRYRWWPTPSAVVSLPALYIARPQALADTDAFSGVLGDRLDVIELGALARAAQWPGTDGHPNAYFNLQLARQLRADYEAQAVQIDLRDDDQHAQSIVNRPWGQYADWDYADDRGLRDTDSTVYAYF